MHRRMFITGLLALSLLVACGENGETDKAGDGQTPAKTGEANAGATENGGTPAGDWEAAYDRGLDAMEKLAKEDRFQKNPGFQALGVTGFVVRPGGLREGDREFVDKWLGSIVGYQKENGAIYDQAIANYTTCAALMALTSAKGSEYEDAIRKAAEYVKSCQNPDGGIGYSEDEEGESDLSNTQFAIEALRKAGVPADDPVFSKALKFLQSVQNDSESNDADYELEDGRVVEIQDDGGAFYAPGESKAGVEDLPNGKAALRSYGSMTYALLKCYLLAGLPKDDPRVQAAAKWAENHYTLEENPGFVDDPEKPNASKQGYYYYLMTMAKALDLLGVEELKDADGVAHDWKKEMREELLSRQNEDGTWTNEKSERWLEGDPIIATSYALIALSHCTE